MDKTPSSQRALGIVVDTETFKLWQSIKTELKAKKDSTAFIRLIAKYKELTGE